MRRSLFLLLTVALYSSRAADLTLDPKTKGEDVVDGVLKKIKRADLAEFTDDQGFLKRLACVESSYGNDPSTYTPRAGKDYYGGVWQLDEDAFQQTVSSNLQGLYIRLEDTTGINWVNVKWADLWKPMYSGLAVRILFAVKGNKFPGTIREQAKFWKDNYRPAGNEQTFLDRLAQCERKTCKGRMDLSILLDGSASVQPQQYMEAKTFVNNLMNTFSSTDNAAEPSVRFAFQTYSDGFTSIFPLDNKLTPAQRAAAVIGAYHPASGTATGEAMAAAVDGFKLATGARPGVAKVMVVFTDGRAQSQAAITAAAAKASEEQIAIFAVGIGENIQHTELVLIAQNQPDRAFTLASFDALAEFFRRMNEETCKIPQVPPGNTTTVDELEQDEKRYFTFNCSVTELGLTVTMDHIKGLTAGYYSYTDDTPSAAIHDGVIPKGRTHIPANGPTVYIGVIGLESINEYSLHTICGKPDPPTCPPVEEPPAAIEVSCLKTAMSFSTTDFNDTDALTTILTVDNTMKCRTVMYSSHIWLLGREKRDTYHKIEPINVKCTSKGLTLTDDKPEMSEATRLTFTTTGNPACREKFFDFLNYLQTF